MFLRKSSVTREPLPIAMSGVRMGERVLQIGAGDVRLAAALAAKPGMSGHCAMVVRNDREAERAQSAAARSGTLMEVHVVASGSMPFDDESFDVAIVHATDGSLATMSRPERAAAFGEYRRVLRPGGRILALEPGTRTGMASWFRASPPRGAYDAEGGTAAALEAAGFRAIRLLADREGYRFIEGLKRKP